MTRPLLVALRPLGLGDHLTGLPALRGLAAAFPGHHKVLATSAAMVPLARHTGAVDEVVAVEALRPLPAPLLGADVAVDLHGRGPQSQRLLLDTGPRRLISFECPSLPETDGGAAWRPDEHEVARWCRMLASEGVAADPTLLGIEVPDVAPDPSAVDSTLLHVGAASAARRWPPERFAELAVRVEASGRRVSISAGPGEEHLAATVSALAGLPPERTLAPGGLLTLVASVAAARAVVVGDTGVAHVATAVGTASVVLFGPVPPSEWGPPETGLHRALWAGRRGDPHGSTLDPGLASISVDEVVAALASVPASPVVPRAGAAPAPGHTRGASGCTGAAARPQSVASHHRAGHDA